jgi:hypothetical protein
MADPGALTPALVIPFVLLFLRWLKESRTAATVRPDGTLVLRYPFGLRAMSVMGLVVPLALTALMIAIPPKAEKSGILWAICGGFGVFASLMFLEVFCRRIELREDRIVSRSAWTGRREVAWSSLVSATWNYSMSWATLVSGDGHKIRVSPYLAGAEALAERLTKHQSPAVNCYTVTSKLRRGIPGRG